jgi:hypothetical protein
MIKGKGVDCLNLIAAVLGEAKIVEPVKRLPSYPLAWGLMSPENVLGKGLGQVLTARRLDPSGFKFGDIVVFKAGRQSNHVGIIVDGRLWHVMTGGTVQPTLIARHIGGIQEIVRLIDRGWKKDPNTVKVKDLAK